MEKGDYGDGGDLTRNWITQLLARSKLHHDPFTHHVRDELATLRRWNPSSSHWLDGRPGSTLIYEILINKF